jgi:hypothetical protein
MNKSTMTTRKLMALDPASAAIVQERIIPSSQCCFCTSKRLTLEPHNNGKTGGMTETEDLT